MEITSVAMVQWPDGLLPYGPAWDSIRRSVNRARPDILVTNEMPFGEWLAGTPIFDRGAAERSASLHEAGLAALAQLDVPAIISSRPVLDGDRLANEAFVLEAGQVRPCHRKMRFPQEPGWYEQSWFHRGDEAPECVPVGALKVGVLLCTELFFNEHARDYGMQGADLIVVPRASGASHARWQVGTAMAAIVSGAYVVSSNRAGVRRSEAVFGGAGMAVLPDGQLLAKTNEQNSMVLISVDASVSRAQKLAYPCYLMKK